MSKLTIWLVVASSLLVSQFRVAEAHGYLITPFLPRNARDASTRHDCPHCANGNGVCGEGNQWTATAAASDVDGFYTGPLSELRGGQIIEFGVRLTTPHRGIFTLELCRPTGPRITDECFTQRLKRDPTDTRFSPYVPQFPHLYSCALQENQVARFIIPTDFGNCEHCILRWFWQTGNSCNPHTLQRDPELVAWSRDGCRVADSSVMVSCGTDCPRPSCNFEHFKNCLDVKIVGGGGDTTTTTTTTTTPTTTTRTTTTTTTTRTTTTTTPGGSTSSSLVTQGQRCEFPESQSSQIQALAHDLSNVAAERDGEYAETGESCFLPMAAVNELRELSMALEGISHSHWYTQ